MSQFWIPEYKYQLVNWLNRYDPKISWERKKKKQLLAIYITLRKKGAILNENNNLNVSFLANRTANFTDRPRGGESTRPYLSG